MSSWRSGRGLHWQHVKLCWTPCPRGLRQCWKVMVATQNIDTLGPIWTFSLRGVLTFVASGLDINGCVLRGQQMYTVIQAVHSLLYIVAKCNFFSVVTWKDIITYLQKCEGCTPVRYCISVFINDIQFDVYIILGLKAHGSHFILKCPYYAILKVPNFVLEVSYNRIPCKHFFFFLFNIHCSITVFYTEFKRFNKISGLAKPLLSKNLLCSDWSDGPICCYTPPINFAS